MNRYGLFKFGIFAFLFLNAFSIDAQEKKCDMKVNVFEPDEIIMLIEANVSVKSLKSGAVFETNTRFEPFIFRNLPEDDYEITVVKDNFKQGVQRVKLNCNKPERTAEKTFGIILQKGSPTEKVVVDERDETQNEGRTLKAKEITLSREERLKKFAEVNNIINFRAVSLGKPKYPAEAKAAGAAGVVYVRVTVDAQGKVNSAQAVGGHPLLWKEAAEAAQKSKFASTTGQTSETTGIIIYNFIL